MIIAVNIRRALASGLSVINSTSRAWALSLQRCQQEDYVIGVVNGQIQGYFRLINVNPDQQFPNRVRFFLQPCNQAEINTINNHIIITNANLVKIQRGKYI